MTEEDQGRASQPLDPNQAPPDQPQQQPTVEPGQPVPGPAPAETPAPEDHDVYVVRDGNLVKVG